MFYSYFSESFQWYSCCRVSSISKEDKRRRKGRFKDSSFEVRDSESDVETNLSVKLSRRRRISDMLNSRRGRLSTRSRSNRRDA